MVKVMKVEKLVAAMTFIMIILSLILIAPSSSMNTQKYYTYEFKTGIYETGEQPIVDKIVFKLVEVNSTAYKLVVVEINKTSMLGRSFKVSVLNLLQKTTGGIVSTNMFDGRISLPSPLPYTFWFPASMLKKAVNEASMIKNNKNKVCELYEEMMNCRHTCVEKYSNDESARRSCLINCYEHNPLRELNYALSGELSPAAYDLSWFVCNKISYTLEIKEINARHDTSTNTYVFELEASHENKEEIYVKTIYSSNGWLLYCHEEEKQHVKKPNGEEVTRRIVDTIKLVDTNDEELEKTMSQVTSNMEQQFPMGTLSINNTVLVAAIAGIAAATIGIALALKKKH